MWHNIFVEQIPLAEKILRTVFVYAVVVILIRATGKRGLAGLNTLDIVVMTLLSNVVQNAIIGNDLSVTGGAIGATTLVAVNAVVNRLTVTHPFLARIFDGTETQVITNGQILQKPLRRLGMSRSTLDHAVRLQNGENIAQVQTGVLEPDGQLLLTLREKEQPATKADIDRLRATLERMETALAQRG